MRTTARAVTAISAAALLLIATATPALAAPPTIEKIPIEFTFEDDFLTAECGVDVTTTLSGFRIERGWLDGGGNVLSLATIRVAGTASSEFGSFKVMDVGADQLKVAPDGTLTLSIIGQVPFNFKGVLVVNADTGEVVKEPHFTGDEQLARACEVLTGA
ncbi:hypothetical protein [Agromyces humatus]|uniref:Uncharacterized protein n=1 Tax=Agromyces humatus TaxID=279573 RepID=A0ABN2KZS6_9MICO|nr:hypothetical protein [Agromyces humatus]